jgi:hypothetical protein
VLAEDDGRLRLEKRSMLTTACSTCRSGHADERGIRCRWPLLAGSRLDAQGVALVALGERRRWRSGWWPRTAACGAILGRRVEDEFEILAEAEVEHLVGLVEHDGLGREVERAALDVVAQASGCADDDMGAVLEQAALGAGIHAADAGDDDAAPVSA